MKKIKSAQAVLNLLREEQMVMPGTYRDMCKKYWSVPFLCGCGSSHGLLTSVNFDFEVAGEFEYSLLALRCPEWSVFKLEVTDDIMSRKKPTGYITWVQLKGIFNLKIVSLWYAEESVFMEAQDDLIKMMQSS